jgi:hypothetical protein
MNNEVFTASPAPVLDVKLKTNWNIVLWSHLPQLLCVSVDESG